jgi:hypothetical protein
VKKRARKSPMRRSYESYISTSDGSQSRYYDYQARSVILEGQACSVVPRCAKVCPAASIYCQCSLTVDSGITFHVRDSGLSAENNIAA